MSTKTVILCEKPDMARNIGDALGGYQKNDGYIETHNYIITWGFGHLVSLAKPNHYLEDDKITKQILPIIPNEFVLEVIKEKSKQFYIIKKLFLNATNIINAGDAGREGELIFRYIYTLSGATAPFQRLWLKSLTKKGILDGFDNLFDGSEKDNLYYSAKARSEADWLVGLNASIAFTYKANIGKNLSLGRVQTPTLKMIVDRFLEIQNFVKEPLFSPFIILDTDSGPLQVNYNTKLKEKPSDDFFESFGNKAVCIFQDKKDRVEKQPLPFDLPTLQQQASRKFKYTAKKTSDIMQSLYEKHKVLTYPRTDSRYLTDDVFETVPAIIKDLENFDITTKDISNKLLSNPLPKNCVNNEKVTDHHAIIPTGKLPENLNQEEQNVFVMVYDQFLASFMEPCEKMVTVLAFSNSKAHTIEENPHYIVKGTVIKKIGWRALLQDNNTKDLLLPNILLGDELTVLKKDIKQSFTKPKSLFTDGTLVAAMSGAGKEFDSNYDIPKDIKENGIGRQGTRDQVIETLLKRQYISRDKNYLIPSQLGILTIESLSQSDIASVSLTGNWENKLERIAKGSLTYDSFIQDIASYTTTLTEDIDKLDIKIEKKTYQCPKCKQKTVENRPKAYACQNDDCDFIIFKNISFKNISDTQIIQILTKGTSNLIKGFVSKKDPNNPRKFDAKIGVDEQGNLKFFFEKPKATLTKKHTCPTCKKGEVKESAKSFYCSEYKNNCKFSIWKETFKKKLSKKNIEDLITHGRTDLIDGFKSKNNKPFSAFLVLDSTGKVSLEFETIKR